MDDTGKAVVESADMRETDRLFAGSIPEAYDRYLGPLLFEPYVRDLVAPTGPPNLLSQQAPPPRPARVPQLCLGTVEPSGKVVAGRL